MSVITNPTTAFPLADRTHTFPGMSLRDWFAGQVLASGEFSESVSYEAAAIGAYKQADAMLAAREVKP